jgi:glycosyltransferase involved in cell wall biosynthesis
MDSAEGGAVDRPVSPRLRTRRGATLSVIIPMHNEEAVLDVLFSRLDEVLPKDVSVEIVCVDDGSRDGTAAALAARAAVDPRLRILLLARNFGQEAALTAGLEAACGDMLVLIDADLQDPPELIGEFIELWEQGYDVVYGIRADRSRDGFFKRSTAGVFYRVFNALSDVPIPADTGSFRLVDRKVVEALNDLPERTRFLRGLFTWVGFRQVGVPYVRPERAAGSTSYGLARMWRLAVDGLTSFTTAPLRIWTAVGLALGGLALLYAAYTVVKVLVHGREAPGWASLMVVMLFGFAVQMIAFGVLGEYVGRLYQEVKGRPIYLVREKIGFDR